MIIHQAVFGPQNGHAFLEGSSIDLVKTFRNAAWLTDLPQTAPSGVAWREFLRLVRVEDYFLLICTRPYKDASRTGVVLSRVAFIPVDMLEHIHDLRPIARELRAERAAGDILQPITLPLISTDSIDEEPSTLVIQIAAALNGRVRRPLVVIGQENFDEAMLDFWVRAPSEFREQLTFGLSFGSDDVRDLTIVCTPAELTGRWEPDSQVAREENLTYCPFVAALLNLPTGASLREFARSLQLSLNSPAAIQIALNAFQFWKEPTGPSAEISLLRILAERAKASENTLAVQSEVVTRLVSSMANWSGQDVLSMRNLDLSGPGADLVVDAITNWIVNSCSRLSPADFGKIVESWLTEKPKALWLGAVESAFNSILSSTIGIKFLLMELWNALVRQPERTGRVLALVASVPLPEKCLLSVMPRTLDESVVEKLIPEFILRDWWQIVGVLLSRSRPIDDSLKAALALNPGHSKKTLLESVLGDGSAEAAIAAAIKSKDVLAVEIVADVVRDRPELLRSFDWRDPVWYTLVNAIATQASPEFIDMLPNSKAGIGLVLDSQIVDDIVWLVISTTALANLLDVPGRERAWTLIPPAHKSAIATATAAAWLSRFDESQVTLSDLEPTLVSAVRNQVSARGYLISILQQKPSALFRYLQHFGFSSESEAEWFLSDLRQSSLYLTDFDASVIGRILLENQWRDAARTAALNISVRPDFRSLVKECYSLLGFLERIFVGMQLNVPVQFSADEAWDVLEAEATRLYPWGPSEQELWSRSGGHNKDLENDSSGSAKWHRCLKNLRAGKAPGVKALLHVMTDDFPHNDTLKQLQRQFLGSKN